MATNQGLAPHPQLGNESRSCSKSANLLQLPGTLHTMEHLPAQREPAAASPALLLTVFTRRQALDEGRCFKIDLWVFSSAFDPFRMIEGQNHGGANDAV